MLEITLCGLELVAPEALVLNILFKLARVNGPLAFGFPALAAKTGQRPNTRRTLVVDDIVGVAAGKLRAAILVGEGWQA